MPQPIERGALIGLIREIVMTASTRAVTDGDRILTVEEFYENAQGTLDRIAHECDLVLGDCDIKELRAATGEWTAWRKARIAENPELEAAFE